MSEPNATPPGYILTTVFAEAVRQRNGETKRANLAEAENVRLRATVAELEAEVTCLTIRAEGAERRLEEIISG